MELTTGTMSFGEELKRERELREISLREVSESTKISLRYLEALERNDFGALPGGVFNRGFVRAYSQYIGVDPDTMVDAYMLQETTTRGEAGTDRARDAQNATGKGRLLWIWCVVAVLIAGAATYVGWTYYKATRGAPPIATPAGSDNGEDGT